MSDVRYLNKTEECDLGLSFILELEASLASWDSPRLDNTGKEYGVLAQGLRDLLHRESKTSSALVYDEESDCYSVRHEKLIVPMIKAIADLATIVENLKEEVHYLRKAKND